MHWRMIAGAILVLVVTHFSSLLGMVLGYYAFAAFCLVLSLMLPSFGIGTAFVASLACATLIQAASRMYMKRVR